MSLDNLKISPFLVRELYPDSLIETASLKTVRAMPAVEAGGIKYLGNNRKNILVLVNIKDHLFLGDDELNFLITILNACGISMEDAALVNVNQNPAAVNERLTAQFSPEVLLFFDTAPEQLEFPLQIPQYRVQQYGKQQFLVAPSLKIVAGDKEEKKLLWNALKQLFAI